jgi:hypothetical protein
MLNGITLKGLLNMVDTHWVGRLTTAGLGLWSAGSHLCPHLTRLVQNNHQCCKYYLCMDFAVTI